MPAPSADPAAAAVGRRGYESKRGRRGYERKRGVMRGEGEVMGGKRELKSWSTVFLPT